MTDGPARRRVQLELELDDEDVRLLEGALLAAKAAELAEIHRRSSRLSFGYGTDSARESMDAEIDRARRRKELIEELLAALERSTEKQ